MNVYSSTKRRMWIKGLKEVTISPPNDLLFGANTAWNTGLSMFVFPQEWINKDSIAQVKAIGLFSNFADGLVYKVPGDVLEVRTTMIGLEDDEAIAGNGAITAGDKTLTGDGSADYTAKFSSGNYLRISDDTDTFVFRVDSVTDATHLELLNYPLMNESGSTVTKLRNKSGVTGSGPTIEIFQLNTMHPAEYVLDPQDIASVSYDYLGIVLNYRSASNIEFLTKSVSTDFDGDTCSFDVALDIEITSL